MSSSLHPATGRPGSPPPAQLPRSPTTATRSIPDRRKPPPFPQTVRTTENYKIQAAKFGFEFEVRNLRFFITDHTSATTAKEHSAATMKRLPFSASEEKAIKGSPFKFFTESKIKPTDPHKLPELTPYPTMELTRPNMAATAETGPDMEILSMELIFGGPTGEPWAATPAKQGAAIGAQVVSYLGDWGKLPAGTVLYAKPQSVLTGPERDARAHIFWKAEAKTFVPENTFVGTQFSTAFPLSGIASILDVLTHDHDDTTKPAPERTLLVTQMENKMKNVEIEALEHYWPAAKLPATWKTPALKKYGQATTRGFLILVISYITAVKSASSGDSNLKTLTPVMPRTDFLAMLHLVLDTMSATGQADFHAKLPEIVRQLVDGQRPLNTMQFGWLDEVNNNTEIVLKVDVWLTELLKQSGASDKIAFNDREYREAQVGALGNIVASVIGQDPKTAVFFCPVIEFRGIGGLSMKSLSPGGTVKEVPYLLQLEEEIRKWHKQARDMFEAR